MNIRLIKMTLKMKIIMKKKYHLNYNKNLLINQFRSKMNKLFIKKKDKIHKMVKN